MARTRIARLMDEIEDLSRAYRSLELMASSNTDNDPSPVLAILNDRFDLLIETMSSQSKTRKPQELNHD